MLVLRTHTDTHTNTMGHTLTYIPSQCVSYPHVVWRIHTHTLYGIQTMYVTYIHVHYIAYTHRMSHIHTRTLYVVQCTSYTICQQTHTWAGLSLFYLYVCVYVYVVRLYSFMSPLRVCMRLYVRCVCMRLRVCCV